MSLAVGALLVAVVAGYGYLWLAALITTATLIVAWRAAPLHEDCSVSHWEAQARHVREESVIIYWRPGCPFCLRLRIALGQRSQRASLVNIWDDDAAAAFVRDVNGGNETVPTVVLGNGDVITNPSPAAVLHALEA